MFSIFELIILVYLGVFIMAGAIGVTSMVYHKTLEPDNVVALVAAMLLWPSYIIVVIFALLLSTLVLSYKICKIPFKLVAKLFE